MANRSPFPGMDPWLEYHWEAVHHSYMQYTVIRSRPNCRTGCSRRWRRRCTSPTPGRSGRPRAGAGRTSACSGAGAARALVDAGELPEVVAGGVAVATPVRVPLSDEPRAVTHVVIRSLARANRW